MPPIADSILILLLLTNFFILGTANLRSAIRGVALQGLLLGVLPLFVESQATLLVDEIDGPAAQKLELGFDGSHGGRGLYGAAPPNR